MAGKKRPAPAAFRRCVLAFAFVVMPVGAEQYIEAHIPDARPVGEARLKVLFWDFYDATLYAPGGVLQAGRPLALRLAYLRKLYGDKIADRSIKEMRAQGFDDEAKLSAWHQQLRDIFPDVDKHTVLTGVHLPGAETVFYRNGKRIGAVTDPAFGPVFFDIWLGEKTGYPDLRRRLLGRP